MKALHNFIVAPYGSEYNNTKTIAGEQFIVNTTLEDAKYVNRLGVVLSLPVHYSGNVKKGDVVVLHHNVFRIYYDMQGKQKHSFEYFRDGVYMVDPNKIYLHSSDGEKWESHLDYCFVRPMRKVQGDIASSSTEEEHKGEMVYNTKSQEEMGIQKGDVIGFTKNSEYAFNLNGEVLYRMRERDVVLKFN